MLEKGTLRLYLRKCFHFSYNKKIFKKVQIENLSALILILAWWNEDDTHIDVVEFCTLFRLNSWGPTSAKTLTNWKGCFDGSQTSIGLIFCPHVALVGCRNQIWLKPNSQLKNLYSLSPTSSQFYKPLDLTAVLRCYSVFWFPNAQTGLLNLSFHFNSHNNVSVITTSL